MSATISRSFKDSIILRGGISIAVIKVVITSVSMSHLRTPGTSLMVLNGIVLVPLILIIVIPLLTTRTH